MRAAHAKTVRWIALFCLLGACAQAERKPEVVWVALGGETHSLELALDPQTRFRGLSGRDAIAPRGGMLFVLPRPQSFAMVMRDCPAAIDVAFLDARGTVVGLHEMKPETPRRPDETAAEYEERLPAYPAPGPVQFAIEVAGWRLGQLGVKVGDTVPLDVAGLVRRAR